MSEVTATVPVEVTDLDAGSLLDLVAEDRRAELKAARRKLQLVHQFCVLHPVVDGERPAGWADVDRLDLGDLDDHLGGDGTPAVAAFAAERYAASAHLSRAATLSLLADALDLHHRLPSLWAQVELLQVEGWEARRVAELSRHLSFEAARWFDQRLAEDGRWSWRAIEWWLAMATAKFHPDLVVDDKQPRGKAHWDVTLAHDVLGTASGTSELQVLGDSLDLARFHDLVCAEAGRLKRLGDTDTLGQRKAKALGVIADRDQALLDFDADDEGAASSGPSRPRHRGLRVLVHVSLTDLLNLTPLHAPALAATDRFGPVLVEQLRDWLTRHGSTATVTPVIDMQRRDAVDRHDPPEWMATQVRIRDEHCQFPHCRRSAWTCDLDHVTPYDPDGPPGQTNPQNLAPLCRRHHLAKTHDRWSYVRNKDGTSTWANQYGRSWWVTRHGTLDLP